jgi:glycosyltransferase involved in cell wall biosynthesis
MQPNARSKKNMEADKPPSIMIATPMYGGMCTGNYMVSVLGAVMKLKEFGMPVYFSQLTNESLIPRARNELVRKFLDAGHDYLMFIDADIGFHPMAIPELIASDRDIVCGIYPKKEVFWHGVEKAAKEGKDNLIDYSGAFVFNMVKNEEGVVETDDTGVLEVRHGGTGFMLIKRTVFDQLKSYVPTYRVSSHRNPETNEYIKPLSHEFFATSIDSTGALLSEDYHFCELWRKHGGKVYAHPFIKLQHVGTYVYEGDIVKSGGNLK